MIFKVIIFISYVTILTLGAIGGETNDSDVSYVPLVRKRRYLTFPVGTSLQLVYCLTVPMIGPYGAFITVGSTAALAWPLPATAEEILELKGKRTTTTEPPTTLPHLIHDEHHLQDDYDFSDSSHKRIDKPFNSFKYRSKLPIKSYYNPFTYNKPLYEYSPKINYKQNVYSKTIPSDYKVPSNYVHPIYYDVHRRTRRELYGRVEKLFKALNRDGKACLLKAICEVSQAGDKKGTLIVELLKAVFRLIVITLEESAATPLADHLKHRCQYAKCKLLSIQSVQHRKTRERIDLWTSNGYLPPDIYCNGREWTFILYPYGLMVDMKWKSGGYWALATCLVSIKPHENHPDEDHYDSAANKSHNCQEQYPTCENSIWGDMLF